MANFEFHSEQTNATASADQMAKHTAWLLVEIDRELRGAPDHVRQAAIQEVEEHISCSRMALEEIGVSPSESDREAVERFGSPQEYARKILGRVLVTDKKMPRGMLITIVLTMIFYAALPFFMIISFPLLYLGGIGILAFILSSWHSKAFFWKPLFKLGATLGAVFTIAMGFCWFELWSEGGMGELPRWALNDFKSMTQQQMDLINRARLECDPIQKTFKQGQSAVEASPYYSKGAYEMIAFDSTTWSPSYRLGWTTDYIDAAESWRAYGGASIEWKRDLASLETQGPALERASRRVFDPMTATQGAIAALFLTCVAMLLNFVTFVLRSIYEVIKRIPRRQTA